MCPIEVADLVQIRGFTQLSSAGGSGGLTWSIAPGTPKSSVSPTGSQIYWGNEDSTSIAAAFIYAQHFSDPYTRTTNMITMPIYQQVVSIKAQSDTVGTSGTTIFANLQSYRNSLWGDGV